MRRGVAHEFADEMIVRMLIEDKPLPRRPFDAEVWAAMPALTARKLSSAQIATRVRRAQRSVMRIQRRLGLVSLIPPGTNQTNRPVPEPTRHPVRTIGAW